MNAVVASNNKNKIREIKEILGDKFENIFSLKELNIDIDIEETGKTFEENAYIKASTIAQLTGMTAIADDSGLCVDELGGEPGVYSARYAGEPCNDENNNAKLLNNLQVREQETEIINRRAHFISVVVLCNPDLESVSGRGEVVGEIIDERRGKNGFGYDPIFFCNELNKTFAEAESEEKNKISHRFRAIQDLLKKLEG